ncbi:MAG: zf-TFIIB domain-containing protein [Nitrospirae bacterium]|nr:zf-TFIIB domain-containing protein [Nitrospirota bacterium]
MPIYEYECPSCGKHYELIQRFSDEPLYTCPECGGHVHKLISHSSFILKGAGWYVTDYASPERKKIKDSEEKPVTKTETKADTSAKK